jgi:hypothetical protein
MKELLEQKKVLLLIGGMVIIVLIVLGAVSLGRSGVSSNQGTGDEVTTIEAKGQNGDDRLVIHSDGRVEVHRGGKMFSEFWTRGKTSALFAYYNDFYAQGAEITNGKATFTYSDDELIDAVIDETTGSNNGGSGGGTGGSGPGQDIDDLFNTPTPAPTSTGRATRRTPTPTPTTPEKEPWCLYWRLSYCVIAYKTPSPSGPSATPAANILPPNCPENTLTGRTVIGNELCLPSPTPSPTP